MELLDGFRRRPRDHRGHHHHLAPFHLPPPRLQQQQQQVDGRRGAAWPEQLRQQQQQQQQLQQQLQREMQREMERQVQRQRDLQRDMQHGYPGYAPPFYPPPAHNRVVGSKDMVYMDQRVPTAAPAAPTAEQQAAAPFPGWGVPGAAQARRAQLQLRMVDMFPLAGLNMGLVAQEGSAFQRVVRSSSDLGYIPPSRKAAALHPGEKDAEAVPKKEFHPIPHSESRVTVHHVKELVEHEKGYPFSCGDEEESTDDSKQSSDLGLPFKKRKPRLDNSKMDHLKEDINVNSKDNSRYCQLDKNDSMLSQYDNLRDLQSSISLTGKFNSWSSEQVQLWLRQALTESNTFSQDTIHKTLQKIHGEKGFDLTTFTRTQWREKLSDCDEPTAPIRMWEHVWNLVIEKSRDTSLRPHNYSTEPSREIENMNMHAHYALGGNMSSALENPLLSKKLSKPPRRRRDKCVGQLWEFVYNLLQNKDMENVVRWEDKEKQLFRIVNTEEIARLWGNHKGNRHMTYANMSRTMRYYREGNGAFVRNERKRVYGFGPKANLKRLEAKAGRRLVK